MLQLILEHSVPLEPAPGSELPPTPGHDPLSTFGRHTQPPCALVRALPDHRGCKGWLAGWGWGVAGPVATPVYTAPPRLPRQPSAQTAAPHGPLRPTQTWAWGRGRRTTGRAWRTHSPLPPWLGDAAVVPRQLNSVDGPLQAKQDRCGARCPSGVPPQLWRQVCPPASCGGGAALTLELCDVLQLQVQPWGSSKHMVRLLPPPGPQRAGIGLGSCLFLQVGVAQRHPRTSARGSEIRTARTGASSSSASAGTRRGHAHVWGHTAWPGPPETQPTTEPATNKDPCAHMVDSRENTPQEMRRGSLEMWLMARVGQEARGGSGQPPAPLSAWWGHGNAKEGTPEFSDDEAYGGRTPPSGFKHKYTDDIKNYSPPERNKSGLNPSSQTRTPEECPASTQPFL